MNDYKNYSKDYDKKKNLQEKYAEKARKSPTTSKDVPGTGMMKKTAHAIEKRKKMLDEI